MEMLARDFCHKKNIVRQWLTEASKKMISEKLEEYWLEALEWMKEEDMKGWSYEDALEVLAAEKEIYPPIGKWNRKLLWKYWKIVLTDTEPSDTEIYEKKINMDDY